MNHLCNVGQVADTIVDEIHLSVARHLKINSVSDDLRTKSMYFRLNRIAVGRRRLDDTQIASTNERELEGTRYRRSRHGQRIDVWLHLTEFFFGRNTELLLLIDDEQTKVLELHRFAYELVRTYYNIYVTIGQIL